VFVAATIATTPSQPTLLLLRQLLLLTLLLQLQSPVLLLVQLLTPVLGEQRGKAALLKQASRVVLLVERLNLPVLNAVMVPWLGFVVLHMQMSCGL
jgi:hypothetical protein